MSEPPRIHDLNNLDEAEAKRRMRELNGVDES